MKYPVRKEFNLIKNFKPPLNKFTITLANGFLAFIGQFYRGKCRTVCLHTEKSDFKAYLYGADLPDDSPCLVYFHGGGFVLGLSPHHYKFAKIYQREAQCKVLVVRYHLAPRHKFPQIFHECYRAYRFVKHNPEFFGVDGSRIAVGGDSAGGCLAAAVSIAASRQNLTPCMQFLLYPVLDCRMITDSSRQFTDTPMWNGRLNAKMWRWYLGDLPATELASPALSEDLSKLPPAYVETAQYDCLHDEGAEYARRLQESGVSVTFVDTEGTVHGYDTCYKNAFVQDIFRHRVAALRSAFNLPKE